MIKKRIKKENEKSNSEIISALEVMTSTEGWRIVLKNIEDNVNYIERQILDKKDIETGKTLSEEIIDGLRIRRSYLIELLETPQKIINSLQGNDDKSDDPDPYHQK